MNLNEMIENLTPEQIRTLLAKVKQNAPKRVSHDRRAKSIAKTALYFSVAPLPYKTTYEEYKNHAEGIRQQIISGVE
jgi:CMP-2-keto-3-deoxyoctulosonic acid synthetase|tara:strand:+ start:279 stop:509 length:231 start_codon:yes stop_codon:yes gene_type:complete